MSSSAAAYLEGQRKIADTPNVGMSGCTTAAPSVLLFGSQASAGRLNDVFLGDAFQGGDPAVYIEHGQACRPAFIDKPRRTCVRTLGRIGRTWD